MPIGKETEAKRKQIKEEVACFLEPREMVWVLSKEEFNIATQYNRSRYIEDCVYKGWNTCFERGYN